MHFWIYIFHCICFPVRLIQFPDHLNGEHLQKHQCIALAFGHQRNRQQIAVMSEFFSTIKRTNLMSLVNPWSDEWADWLFYEVGGSSVTRRGDKLCCQFTDCCLGCTNVQHFKKLSEVPFLKWQNTGLRAHKSKNGLQKPREMLG